MIEYDGIPIASFCIRLPLARSGNAAISPTMTPLEFGLGIVHRPPSEVSFVHLDDEIHVDNVRREEMLMTADELPQAPDSLEKDMLYSANSWTEKANTVLVLLFVLSSMNPSEGDGVSSALWRPDQLFRFFAVCGNYIFVLDTGLLLNQACNSFWMLLA